MLKNNFWKTATVMYRISYIILWATWPTLNFTETRWHPENVQFEVNSEIFHKKVPYFNDNYPNLTIRGISPLYITLYFSTKVFKTSLDKSARHFCKLSNFPQGRKYFSWTKSDIQPPFWPLQLGNMSENHSKYIEKKTTKLKKTMTKNSSHSKRWQPKWMTERYYLHSKRLHIKWNKKSVTTSAFARSSFSLKSPRV